MGKIPGEQCCHHTLNSTPGLTKHPLINKQWGERLNIETPSFHRSLSPCFPPLTGASPCREQMRRPVPFCSALGSFMLGSVPWRAALWQLLRVHVCVCVCWKLTRCPLSMTSSVNRSWAVNTSPADGNDVKPTSHLISPLPALSSLTQSILSLINLFFSLCSFFFTLSSICIYHSLLTSLFSTLLTFDSPLFSITPACLLSFLSACPYVMWTAHSFSLNRRLNASSPRCSGEHFSFCYPPFSSFLRTSIHSSVWFKLQDYFLLFSLKGSWISFHEPGEQERWGEFKTPRNDTTEIGGDA